MERSQTVHFPAPDLQPRTWAEQQQPDSDGNEAHIPAHKHFREKYFAGFKPPLEQPPEGGETS
jgi:hypothetical protein